MFIDTPLIDGTLKTAHARSLNQLGVPLRGKALFLAHLLCPLRDFSSHGEPTLELFLIAFISIELRYRWI
jgi:hypothetical protein